MKAYRRTDSTASGGSRSRSTTKELALPADDNLMCPPTFVTGLKPDLEVIDGHRLELKVSVKGDPDPQVTWTKDGKTLNSSDILEVKYKNGVASVIVKEVYPEDSGKYTCKATNTKGSVETGSKVKVISSGNNGNGVNGGAANVPPRIAKHNSSQIVNDSEKVHLECSITGSRFDVVWLHNEKEIKPSKDFVYSAKGSSYSLDITEVFPEDAGTYTCEAFNDVGECFSTCTLEVVIPGEDNHGVPTFKAFPKSISVDKGGNATFVAETDTIPTEISWMKDGKPIKEIPLKVRFNHNKTRLSLDIMDCSIADNGQYAVIVINKQGETKSAFCLNVH